MAINSEHKLVESEFSKMFQKGKSSRSSSSESSQATSQEFSNSALSSVRDPETVKAWRACISQTRETNVYAFANRDGAGKVFVSVIWVPGAFAGTFPSIPISQGSD